ncbi:hypothetical protein HD599_000274 [Conyzicola lurida]|uniref:Integral membrane protein n=1 Tax=Conyzicola lurida TaxID=1172621 RepID=A0A841AJR5_9MICO|nr:hypothetical protein [Conyzicola lurida]MBB5841951.1 hypothetical protein [Conyzicola lurida]
MARLTTAQLQELVDALRAENDSLRDENVFLRETKARPTATKKRGAWGRTLASVVLIVVGSLLAPVAVAANWAQTQLLQTEVFVSTFAPLARDRAVQAFVTDEVVAVIDSQVDIEQITGDVFDGIVDLGLGPVATTTLRSLEGTVVQGIRSLIRNTVSTLVASDAFGDIFEEALRTSHREIVAAIHGDDTGAVSLGPGGEVGIRLAPVLDRVETLLVDQGLTFAANLPELDRTIVIAKSDSVTRAQLGYDAVVAIGLWLPWLVLVVLAAGVLAARRRSLALVWAGGALALALVVCLAAIAVGRVFFVGAVSPAYMPSDVAVEIYQQLTTLIRTSTIAALVLAVTVALVAWLAGPFRVPSAGRAFAVSGAAIVRTAAEKRGITTGRFGFWLYRARTPVRAAIAVVGAAVILLARPLSPGLTLWTAVLAALAVGLVELLQRPPAEEVALDELLVDETAV